MEQIQLLKNLIQIPSPSGQEHKLAKFIMFFCKKNKLPAKLVNGSVVIHLQGKDNKTKALIFNAHLDTVGVGDKRKWKYPPFGSRAGRITTRRMYGLGASDDKAAIASILIMAKKMVSPPFDLWFCFVTNEETDGTGTENFLLWLKQQNYLGKYKKIAAIIGEPTNLKRIEIGHRGNLFIKLTTSGISGHGGSKYSSENLAVEKMLFALGKLKDAFSNWEGKYAHKYLGSPTINITGINSSAASVNKIPSSCEAFLDIRTTPQLHSQIDNLLKKYLSNLVRISYIQKPVPPGLTAINGYFIGLVKKIFPDLKIGISLGSTDLVQFIKYGIETIVIGPGNKESIHQENEYVELKNITLAIEMYKKLICAY